MPIRLSGMISGLDTDAIVKELMSAQSLKKTNVENKKTKAEWKKEKWENLNTKIYALYTEKLSNLKLQGGYLTKKVSSSDEARVKATASNAANGSYSVEVKALASAQYVTGADVSSKGLKKTSLLTEAGMTAGQTITIGTQKKNEETGAMEPATFTLDVTEETTISDLLDKMGEAGLNASFDATAGRFFISAKNSGVSNSFTLSSSNQGEGGLSTLGLGEITEETAKNGLTAADSSSMAILAGSDAEVILNGAHITSATNNISVNGLSLELTGITAEGAPVNLTVGNDVDAVYNKVKEFVKSYNELMKEMYDTYNAPSAKGYNMLTDDEKEAMTEEQVKLWEDKIKNSLLRNDTTLNNLMSVFRTSMQATAEVDGKTYSLASFGIVTGAYTEHGILHINGDSDDGTYADKDDQLRKAIEQDPESVSKALSSIMSGFYNTLTDNMRASSISSALTFYNDKQIQSQITDYEKQITNWEDRLTELEDRYYKQFSAMESSMAKLQSQQQQMANMMGF